MHVSRAQKAAAAARAAAAPRLTPAERRTLKVQCKRRRREEDAADSTIQYLLTKRRLVACLGAADMVARARAAARACRARVQSLDDRTRATRRSAAVASYIALRIEVEGAQHGAQEILLRMRTAARDRRSGVIARRMGHEGHPRVGYQRVRLVGVTPRRRSRVRAAASEAAAKSGPIYRHDRYRRGTGRGRGRSRTRLRLGPRRVGAWRRRWRRRAGGNGARRGRGLGRRAPLPHLQRRAMGRRRRRRASAASE